MMNDKPHPLALLFRLSRPDLLLADIFIGLMGLGIARYLNFRIDWILFWLGTAWVMAVQLGAVYLHQYFDLRIESDRESHTRLFAGNPVLGSGEEKLPRSTALNLGLAVLAIAGAISVMLFRYPGFGFAAALLMGLTLTGALAYSLPPLRLARSGYGELLVAVFFGYLVHSLAFVLQAGIPHRLVTMVALPLILLITAAQLALAFPGYAADQKYGRMNLLQKIGWQNAVAVHNSLIMLAYLSLAGAAVLGFPRSVGLRAVWSFPLAFVPVWLLSRIASGAKPIWSTLRMSEIALIAVMVASFTISFWI
jgi:1,4-dihydroxy-2-naphthoate octaprenyltransferase